MQTSSGSARASSIIDGLKSQALARCQERIDRAAARSKGRKRASPAVPCRGVTSMLRHHHGL
ncbi:MAG: hypothetical protein D5R99_02050 [Methanocalculus sp. MSAO_Arc1]|uniref:hypothetical protein n=1 Tax=Methanocalculus TaxID=71151 RepID=UPI000FF2D61F|nr:MULTISPECIES: hypothetical protein [unclassified Methanocalculus]MCP1662366.1 hypothetical protein [Methanocalculus sp. AMF5]RQD81545.1 MAG: hypothetical protein D5R99_02050 [Methanocalculus sp. MSAO_Arc1]